MPMFAAWDVPASLSHSERKHHYHICPANAAWALLENAKRAVGRAGTGDEWGIGEKSLLLLLPSAFCLAAATSPEAGKKKEAGL